MSVPRRLWVVRAEDLLAVDPHLLRGRRLPEGQVQRRQAGEARGLVVVLDYLVMQKPVEKLFLNKDNFEVLQHWKGFISAVSKHNSFPMTINLTLVMTRSTSARRGAAAREGGTDPAAAASAAVAGTAASPSARTSWSTSINPRTTA